MSAKLRKLNQQLHLTRGRTVAYAPPGVSVSPVSPEWSPLVSSTPQFINDPQTKVTRFRVLPLECSNISAPSVKKEEVTGTFFHPIDITKSEKNENHSSNLLHILIYIIALLVCIAIILWCKISNEACDNSTISRFDGMSELRNGNIGQQTNDSTKNGNGIQMIYSINMLTDGSFAKNNSAEDNSQFGTETTDIVNVKDEKIVNDDNILDMNNINNKYICSLTNKIFSDPIIGLNGVIYERNALLQYIKKNIKCSNSDDGIDHIDVQKNLWMEDVK